MELGENERKVDGRNPWNGAARVDFNKCIGRRLVGGEWAILFCDFNVV